MATVTLVISWSHTYICPFSLTAAFLDHATFLHQRCFCLPYTGHVTHYIATVLKNNVMVQELGTYVPSYIYSFTYARLCINICAKLSSYSYS